MKSTALNIAVTTGQTVVSFSITEGTSRAGILDVTLTNNGPAALTNCIVKLQSNADAPFYSFFGNVDFTDATNPNLIFVSTNLPHTLGPGQSASFKLRIGAATGAAVYCTSAGTSSVSGWLEIL